MRILCIEQWNVRWKKSSPYFVWIGWKEPLLLILRTRDSKYQPNGNWKTLEVASKLYTHTHTERAKCFMVQFNGKGTNNLECLDHWWNHLILWSIAIYRSSPCATIFSFITKSSREQTMIVYKSFDVAFDVCTRVPLPHKIRIIPVLIIELG